MAIETISNIDDENVEKKTFSMEELHDAAVLSEKGDVYTMDAAASTLAVLMSEP